MAYTTDDELAVALGATLSLAGIAALADMPDDFQTIVPSANSDAFSDILNILIGQRGFTKSQIDTWRDKAMYNRSIGQYLAIVEGQGLEGIPVGSAATWGYLDRRKELLTLPLLDEDFVLIEVDPETSTSTVGYGRLNTDEDLTVSDLSDSRRGGPTKW